MHRLIIGCGYLGYRVAQQWQHQGDQVTVLTRSTKRAEQLSRVGLHPLVGDLTHPESLPPFPSCDTVLHAVGYDRSSGKSIQEVYVDGLSSLLDRLPASTGKVIYVSSTGVYAQDDGGWVDEDSPCHPRRPGGIACLAAETLLAQHPRGTDRSILRLAGIYGPGRVPRQAAIQAGDLLPAPPDGYLNLIHVEDAVQVILAIASGKDVPSLLLVSDGTPVLRRHYLEFISRLLEAPTPRFSPVDPDSHVAQRAAANKRICNRRLMQSLEISLQFPSFREGLHQLLTPPDDRESK